VSLNYRKIEKNLFPTLDLSLDYSLFITSLSPLRGEDILIGLLFKQKNKRVSGTIRSWDNIVQNGLVRFLPDKFLSHGDFMAKCMVEMQGMNSHNVISSVSPSYQKMYSQHYIKKSSDIVNIAYVCSGIESNPDELNFLTWLTESWIELPSHYQLTILQHPSFIIDFPPSDPLSKINSLTFSYSNGSIEKYYTFLKNLDLVIGVGTTAVLDASFQGVPILLIGFEIGNINYAASAQRCFDKFPHTYNFVRSTSPCIAISKEELLLKILDYSQINPLNKDSVYNFTGNPNSDLFSDIVDSLRRD